MNMKWIQQVLLKIQSGHNSQMDRRTSALTDGRTGWNQYTPFQLCWLQARFWPWMCRLVVPHGAMNLVVAQSTPSHYPKHQSIMGQDCNSITNALELCLFCINSLWPRDVIWRQGSRSTLAQVMACWRHQAITWANVDLTSVRSSGIHLRTISPKMPKPPITEITFKNYLSKKFHSNLPRANELKHLYDPSEILDLYCTTSLYIPPSLISLTCGSSLHTSTGFLSRFLSVIRCTGNHIRWSSILIGYWISQWQPSVFHNSLRQSIVFNPHLFLAIWCHRRPHTLYRSLINHLLQPRLQLLQTAVCRLNNRHATVVAGAPMETQLEGGDDVMVVTVDGSVTSRRFVHHGMKVGELYEVPRLENTTRNSELSEEQIAVMV